MGIEVSAHTRNVKLKLTDELMLEAWRLHHAGRTLAEVRDELKLECSTMTISRAIQRAKRRELIRQRTEKVRAHILRKLELSPAHEQFTQKEREAMAAQLAAQAVSSGLPEAGAVTAWQPGNPELDSPRFKAALKASILPASDEE